MNSEYKAMCLLHEVMPEMTPKPIACGTYREIPETHFFLSSFVNMSKKIPNVSDFPELVARLHKRGESPDGKFGFPHVMCVGTRPMPVPPCESWEECFTRMIQDEFDREDRVQGIDTEISALKSNIMDKVVPRLLRPLESNGRTVVPTLVHGDLWDGNASVDVKTGHPVIFDPLAMYAHNECE